MTKKVLIIGNSAKAYSLARYFSKENEVYITTAKNRIFDFAENVDIRDDDVVSLTDFALETGIDMAIPLSNKSLNCDLSNVFTQNGISVFAPSFEALSIIYDKAYAKKLLYKLNISTPKFGIFEKSSQVLDYIKNINIPFVIKTNAESSASIITSKALGKNIIESICAEKQQKIIVEDYVWGTPFAFYTITDGYKALPIGTSVIYKHSLEGGGGQLTSGMGACVPNNKLSFEQEDFLMQNVIYPTIDYLQAGSSPYLGILGVNGIVTENGDIFVLGYLPFMLDCDCTAVLENIDEDLYELFNSCIVGNFSDEKDFIKMSDMASVSVALLCNYKKTSQNIIKGIENLEDTTKVDFYPNINKNKNSEIEANHGINILLTTTATTVSKAKNKMADELECIKFDGMNYRKDICLSFND